MCNCGCVLCVVKFSHNHESSSRTYLASEQQYMTLIVGSQELCKWKHLTIYHHSTKCKFIVKVEIIKKIVPKLNRHSGWSQSCHCCLLTAPGPPVFLISGARGGRGDVGILWDHKHCFDYEWWDIVKQRRVFSHCSRRAATLPAPAGPHLLPSSPSCSPATSAIFCPLRTPIFAIFGEDLLALFQMAHWWMFFRLASKF